MQDGRENRAKRHQKWHRKNDEKTKGNKMAKKSQQAAPTTRGTEGPEPWGGGRGRRKPLPTGLKPEGLKEEGLKSRHSTLDHPSPEGWWDYFLLVLSSLYI